MTALLVSDVDSLGARNGAEVSAVKAGPGCCGVQGVALSQLFERLV